MLMLALWLVRAQEMPPSGRHLKNVKQLNERRAERRCLLGSGRQAAGISVDAGALTSAIRSS